MQRPMTHRLVVLTFVGATIAAPLGSVLAQTTPAEEPEDASEGLTRQERKMLGLARAFAQRCERAIESWLDNGEVTEAKLFSFLYYPIPETNPPKFHTEWDRLADRDIRSISDDILSRSETLVFAVLVDRYGYLPAHNQKYSLPLTGNQAVDLVRNRTKRIFADKTGFAAAQNEKPYLIQRYLRDTGEIMEDLSVPVRIRGRKWGAVRLGYRVVADE